MKTPDEIKKGLERCQLDKELLFVDCSHCSYYMDTAHCDLVLHADALAYIQQLEFENADLKSRLSQVERERDAAVGDLQEAARDGAVCTACKHDEEFAEACAEADFDCKQCKQPCMCKTCNANSNYEWLGLCEGNTHDQPCM